MKTLIEDFYHLFFPKDEKGIYKNDIDSSIRFKVVILLTIGLMVFLIAISS